MNSSIGNIDIKDFLPHRAPFLMVDKYLHINDEEVTTTFYIPENCIFLKENILQEFGLIENAAQTCSTIVGKSFIDAYENPGEAKKLIGFISSIKRMQIHDLPAASQTIITKARLISRFDTEAYCVCGMTCETYYKEVLLLSCELNLIIQEVEE